MGFTVKQPKTIELAVEVKLPDGGRQTFTVTAKYLSMKERRALFEDITENESETHDIDILKRLIVGWGGVYEADGGETPFNASNLERIADIKCVYDGLMVAIVTEYLNPMPATLTPFLRKN